MLMIAIEGQCFEIIQLTYILYFEESRFRHNGTFNKQNTFYWTLQHQHTIRDGSLQEKFGMKMLHKMEHSLIIPKRFSIIQTEHLNTQMIIINGPVWWPFRSVDYTMLDSMQQP